MKIYLIMATLMTFAVLQSGTSSGTNRHAIWAGISAETPLYVEEDNRNVVLNFYLVNDGTAVASTELEKAHLVINGRELSREEFWLSDTPHQLAPKAWTGWSVGLAQVTINKPGRYLISWRSPAFDSPTIELRILPVGSLPTPTQPPAVGSPGLSRAMVVDDSDLPGKKTKLFRAIFDGKVATVQQSIRDGVDVNMRGDEGKTPLIYACEQGRLDIALLLIQNGADINASVDDGTTPLIASALKGFGNTATLLIENGADLEKTDKIAGTPLLYAAMYGHVEAVEVLLSRGANVNVRGQQGQTPLIAAADWGNLKVVELLLNAGADVTLKNAIGETALSRAKTRRRDEVIKLLEQYPLGR